MPANTANLTARSSITIAAPAEKVWTALITPAAIKQYMFGTTVVSDWKEGSPIIFKGEWQGKSYEDRGDPAVQAVAHAAVHPHQRPTRSCRPAGERPPGHHPALARGESDPGIADAGQQPH